MNKFIGIEKIKIFTFGNEIMAEVNYFDKTNKTVIWNIRSEREDVMNSMDGYTVIEDTRIKRSDI